MLLSVVIPAYNEVSNIARVLQELQSVIAQCEGVHEYEICVVDDHSSDGTFDAVAQMGDARIRCLRLSRRSGSHTALRAGLHTAKGDAVLCISADGQDSPTALRQMLQKLNDGADTVWALRIKRDEPLRIKLFAIAFYRILSAFTGQSDTTIDYSRADFYLLNRKVVDAINSCREVNTSLFGLIIWIGFRQDSVDYERRGRLSGESKWNMASRMKLAKDWIIAFSGIPLRLMTNMGMVLASLGFLYTIFLIFYSMLGYSTPGWAETVVIILVLGGSQIMMLGLLGEYLWRNLDETRRRPLYFLERDSTDT